MSKVIETIAQAAGFETAATLCQIWGDRTLYIPDSPGPDHPIAQDIGYEPLLAIVAIYGGQTIHPPKLRKSHLVHRAKARFLMMGGISESKVAWVLDITPNRVKQLLAGSNMNHEAYEQQQEKELMGVTQNKSSGF